MTTKNHQALPRASRTAIAAEIRELDALLSELATKSAGGFAVKVAAQSLEARRELLVRELRAAPANGTASHRVFRKQKSPR